MPGLSRFATLSKFQRCIREAQFLRDALHASHQWQFGKDGDLCRTDTCRALTFALADLYEARRYFEAWLPDVDGLGEGA